MQRHPKKEHHISLLVDFLLLQSRSMLGPTTSQNRQLLYQLTVEKDNYIGRSQDKRTTRKWGGPTHRLKEHLMAIHRRSTGKITKKQVRTRYQPLSYHNSYPTMIILNSVPQNTAPAHEAALIDKEREMLIGYAVVLKIEFIALGAESGPTKDIRLRCSRVGPAESSEQFWGGRSWIILQ